MPWFIFAIFTALFESSKDVFSKKGLVNIDEYVVAWSLSFFALPFLLPILFFIKIPSLGSKFWIALIIGGGLNIIATILYMKAIKHSDLSITVPMVSFTPLFLLMTSPLIVGEFPTIFGLIGILLIISGSYILNLKEKTKGILNPFKALLSKKGPKLMLIVAFIWSITSNFDKIGVQNSSPIFWAIAINIFISFGLIPIMLHKSEKRLNLISLKKLVPIGFLNALTMIFQMMAISIALVIYVISIKRASSVISILFGYLIFKEKGITERLFGAIIMITGILFITYF